MKIKIQKKIFLTQEKSYEHIYDYIGNIAMVELDNKYGLIDKNKTEILEPIYDEIEFLFKNVDSMYSDEIPLIKIKLNNKYGLLDTNGKMIKEPIYDEIGKFINKISKVSLNGKYGLITKTGEELVPAKYDAIGGFDNNGISMVIENNNFGLINKEGKELIPPIYKYIQFINDELLCAKKDKLGYGIININNEVIVKPKYSKIEKFDDNFFKIFINDKCGLITKDGSVLVKLKYNNIETYDDKFYEVRKHSKYGLITKDGKEALRPRYSRIGNFKNGVAKTRDDLCETHYYGYINEEGKVIVPAIYEYIDFQDDVFIIKVERNVKNEEGIRCRKKVCGLLDKKGKEIVKPKYDKIYEFNENLAVVELNNKYGVIDKTGKEIIKLKYDNIKYCKPYFIYKLNSKYGLLDIKGNEIITAKYEAIKCIDDELIKINLDYKWGIITKDGKEIVKPKYNDIDYEKGYFIVSVIDFVSHYRPFHNHYKKGVLNKYGKEIIPVIYKNIEICDKDIIKVYDGVGYGLYDGEGNIIVECNHSNINIIDNEIYCDDKKLDLTYELEFDYKGKNLNISFNSLNERNEFQEKIKSLKDEELNEFLLEYYEKQTENNDINYSDLKENKTKKI